MLSFLASLAILLLSWLQHTRAVRPSSLLGVYLVSSLAFDVVQCRTLYSRHEHALILGLFAASIGTKILLLIVESRSNRSYLRAPYTAYSPESLSGIFNRSLFWWTNPILVTGFRKLLTFDDLSKSDHSLLSKPLCESIQRSWMKYHDSGKHAFVFVVFDCLKWSIASLIFPRVCLIGFNHAQPFLISTAITFVSRKSGEKDRNEWYGLLGATAQFI